MDIYCFIPSLVRAFKILRLLFSTTDVAKRYYKYENAYLLSNLDTI